MERILTHLRTSALVLGPLFAILPLFIAPPGELSEPAWRLVGLTAWMALWWFSECVPIPATSLIPLVWMPLVGIADEKQVASRYADPVIFLFLGGFLIALGMQRWGLHRRIAFAIVSLAGNTPAQLIGGFMLATAFLSMWVNNTSTTMMMFAVALSVVEWVRSSAQGSADSHRFAVALMLGIAYSASIGGVGTLIGTAPNALLAGFLRENYNYSLSMANWLFIGLPFVGLMLPFCWLWLTRVLFHAKSLNFSVIRERLAQERAQMPSMCPAERWVLAIFLLAVVGWLVREPLNRWTGLTLSDSLIAMSAGLAMFVLPATTRPREALLDWETAERLPWGVLLLFGGGLALANAFESTGLAQALGGSVAGLQNLSPIWIVLAVAGLIIFLTELTSNTATTATFLPVVSAVAVGMGLDPRLLAIPVAVGASAAFMLPVATPPNAIVFASGEIKIHEMARAGLALNLFCIVLVTLLMMTTARWGLGIGF